jgi:CheY-like chemotaxis protein
MAGKSKEILVVEDDQFLAKVYQTKLKKEGYNVFIALDGEEALSHIKKQKPALILLDLILPKMDGFEVLEKLKNDESTKKIPVIILSNLGQDDDIERGKKLGAEDYFVKANTSLAEILKKIQKYIK